MRREASCSCSGSKRRSRSRLRHSRRGCTRYEIAGTRAGRSAHFPLTSLQPSPDSIWLIGSRANDRATHQSDTDLIVFGSEAFIRAAIAQIAQPQDVDCLVVFNGDDYRGPWQEKSGSLSRLEWRQIDADSARYIGTKWMPDGESSREFGALMGDLVDREELAIRLWP
ncbi:nucleotidyltransferase domain-containing protein [Xanthomonas citri]|uniref:nucleotidyltransferase domain-containing protein n=1 Tax=Xanthomonas citri TaxID=346 RepID=UPI003CE59656